MGRCSVCGKKILYNSFKVIKGIVYCLDCKPEKQEAVDIDFSKMTEVSEKDINNKIAEERDIYNKIAEEKDIHNKIAESIATLSFSELQKAPKETGVIAVNEKTPVKPKKRRKSKKGN